MRAGEYAHRDMPEWAGRRTAAENKTLYKPTYWFIFLFRKSYLSERYGCGRAGGENGKGLLSPYPFHPQQVIII